VRTFIILVAVVFGILGGITTASIFFTTPFSPAIALTRSYTFPPRTISIPRIEVETGIEAVGETEEGRMANPEDTEKVGWYRYGTYPGERGSTVIAGHYDSLTGPAVFYRLSELQKGDDVYVTDGVGRRIRYQVTDVQTYTDEAFPIEKVFGKSDYEQLNLITCEGVFDKESKNYSHRVVVFTKRIPS
jgi:sortase A